MNEPIVIIGAGQAGAELALALRRGGCTQRIVMKGDEPYLPYRRPALSKGFLSGKVPESTLYHTTAERLADNHIEFMPGSRIAHVDPARKLITSADQKVLRYSKLAFATGGSPRKIKCPGADLSNINYLRTIDDARILRKTLTSGTKLVVIGGGYVGLEIAATAKEQGADITVLEAGPRVLRRSTCAEIAAFISEQHRSAGVKIAVNKQVRAFHSLGTKAVTAVECVDGTVYPADLVVVGIGLIANDELAASAGLNVDRGITVDELGQTSDPDIVAVGDCANSMNTFCGYRLRLESVQGAMEQARVAAMTMLGKGIAARSIPTFWSDQYNLKLQMIGVPTDADQIITRSYPNRESFAAFYVRNGILKAAHFINGSSDIMAARRLIMEEIPVSNKNLINPSMSLNSLLTETAA